MNNATTSDHEYRYQHPEGGESMDTTRCITVSYGRVQGGYSYHQPALYRRKPRQDGTWTWRYVRHLGTARRSFRLAILDADRAAAEYGIPRRDGIRHGTPVSPDDIPVGDELAQEAF